MLNDLISVIIPVYNVQKYLSKCINSVINQTYTKLEIILVDDGSQDSSGCICDHYAELDNRIRVIHKTNGGAADARNYGIHAASGSYFVFIDSDDYVSPYMIEILYNALVNNDADLSVCGFKNVYENETENKNDNDNVSVNVVSGEEVLKDRIFHDGNSLYWIIVVNKLFKRSLFKGLSFRTGKIHEDEFILHELMLKCQKIACVDKVLYYYVQREGSVAHTFIPLRELDAVQAFLERAVVLSQISGYENSAGLYLTGGVKLYYQWLCEVSKQDEKEYLNRGRLFQSYFNTAYQRIYKKRFALPLNKRMFLTLNRFGICRVSKLYKFYKGFFSKESESRGSIEEV